jgi:hypothetical protein
MVRAVLQGAGSWRVRATGREVAGERLEVEHLGRLFRADDEPEVMAVVPAAIDEGLLVGGVA